MIEEQIGENLCCFFDQAVKPTAGNNLKVSFEDADHKTPTSMETNFLHKCESTANTSHLLWDWSTVKDMDILFLALSIVFMVQTSHTGRCRQRKGLFNF